MEEDDALNDTTILEVDEHDAIMRSLEVVGIRVISVVVILEVDEHILLNASNYRSFESLFT
jgi:hypothetical protein